jgi:catechol 2,3-dioxygenase-like lactoylglutathione lyase family enzyme
MLLKFTHTRLLVANFKGCFLFYRDLLGFEVTWGSESDVYAEFKAGEVTLDLFARSLMATVVSMEQVPPYASCQDRVALIFAVENVDEAYQTLRQRGAIFMTEPIDQPEWGVRTAHFRDPDGNLLEINASLPA